MTLNKDIVEKLMVPLRQKYIEQMKLSLKEMEVIFLHLQNGVFFPEEIANLKYRAHSFSGSGSTYGFDAVTQAGLRLETEILDAPDPLNGVALLPLLNALIAACKSAIGSEKP